MCLGELSSIEGAGEAARAAEGASARGCSSASGLTVVGMDSGALRERRETAGPGCTGSASEGGRVERRELRVGARGSSSTRSVDSTCPLRVSSIES